MDTSRPRRVAEPDPPSTSRAKGMVPKALYNSCHMKPMNLYVLMSMHFYALMNKFDSDSPTAI